MPNRCASITCCPHPRTESPSAYNFGVEFVWEQHSEFSTYSLIKPGAFTAPFAGSLLEEVPQSWLSALPGRILRATQIALLAQSDPEPSHEWLAEFFALEELVCCDVLGGEARIWSNFRLHDDGLGRLLIRDQALIGDGDPSRLLQRLQELGNYRNMALLGLPLAQRLTPTLSALEHRLAELTRGICERSEPEDQLLHQLTTLSADLARLESETSYRMSATRAYAQLVADRLDSIQVQRVRGFQTLADFTDRRLTPAVRTCESFTRRLEDPLATGVLGKLADAYPYRDGTRAPNTRPARVHEPGCARAIATAASSRGTVDHRDQLLRSRTCRLYGQVS